MLSYPTVARRLAGYCLLASLALFALPLYAAEPTAGGTEDLPDMDVTVQRVRQAKEDVAVPVTIIMPADLPAATGTSVADALRTVPGFDRRPAGSDGAIEGFSLRGAKAEQVLVLIDGRRVGTAQGGGVNLGDLPMADVERIEVLRGGASALYGSDPIGGVINIITKRGGKGLSATLRGGSFGSVGSQLQAGGTKGRATWHWDAEYYNQDGGFTYKTTTGTWASRDNNHMLRRNLSGKASYDLGQGGVLEAGTELYRATRGVPGLVAFPSPRAFQVDERHGAWLNHKIDLAAGTHLATSLNWLDSNRDYDDRFAFFPAVSHHDNRQLSGEMLATFDVAGGRQAVFGIDWRRDEINSSNDGRRHRITGGVFGQYELGLGSFTLTPSARVDWQTGQKPIFTPRVGATWRAAPNLTLRAGGNRSFRAPSFDDLYWPADSYAVGNPNLVPERAVEWNVGLGWQPWQGATLDLDYYNRDAAQLITWQPVGGGKWSPTNVGRVRFQGVETSMSTPLPGLSRWSLNGSYAYLKATTHSGSAAETGRQLIGRPFHQGSATLSYRASRFDAGLTLTAVGDRYTTAANTQRLASYATLDLTARWKCGARDELTFELRNLTNATYQAVEGYPLPGFEYRVAATRSF